LHEMSVETRAKQLSCIIIIIIPTKRTQQWSGFYSRIEFLTSK